MKGNLLHQRRRHGTDAASGRAFCSALHPNVAAIASSTRLTRTAKREPGRNAGGCHSVGGKTLRDKSSSTTSQLPSITTVDGFALVEWDALRWHEDARNPDTAQNVNSLSGRFCANVGRF